MFALLKNARAHSDTLRSQPLFRLPNRKRGVQHTLWIQRNALDVRNHLMYETFVRDFGPLSKVALFIRVISAR